MFTASGAGSATVRVVSVRLLDATRGTLLDTLTARDPQAWTGTIYVPWDGTISAGQSVRATFKVSAPDWNRLGDGNALSTFGHTYRLEVVTNVAGAVQVFSSVALRREPVGR
jgi:hypothetical protein